MDELVGTACHEAGHAVLMVLYGIRLEHVTIVPGDDYMGGVLRAVPPWFDPTIGDSLYTKHYTRVRILGLFAGQLAEQQLAGVINRVGASSDRMQISKLAGHATGSKRAASRLKTKLRKESEEHIGAFSFHITAVAKALLANKTLSEAEVIDEMSQVPEDPDIFDHTWLTPGLMSYAEQQSSPEATAASGSAGPNSA